MTVDFLESLWGKQDFCSECIFIHLNLGEVAVSHTNESDLVISSDSP